MRKIAGIFLLLVMVLAPFSSMVSQELVFTETNTVNARATGVDLTITDVSYSYTSAGDEEKFSLFSSNYPLSVNRPEFLFVIDAMVDVPILVEVTVENIGTSPSGTVDVQMIQLHNEYARFEMLNQTVQMTGLNGGSVNSVTATFTPTYSGNHTMQFEVRSTVVDDNLQNNLFEGTITVGNYYYNCNDLTGWTVGLEWGLSSETGLSFRSSCHIGNGISSSYSDNLATTLTTPIMDMSDRVPSPTRSNGMSLFYSGSAAQGDSLIIQAKSTTGNWFDLGTIAGAVDQNAQNFNTFSFNHAGAISPILPIPPEYFHSQSQFRYLFQSNAAGGDIGYYLDEIVFMYDQKVRAEEYAINVTGVSTTGSVPGQWGTVRVELSNQGNISESFIPNIIGLPNDWDVYFSNTNGVSINQQTGILLSPGQSKFIDIKILPDINSTTGMQQMNFLVQSKQYSNINASLAMQFQVLPDRLPSITLPDFAPSCPPGTVCPFSVEVENIGDATDVFDLTIDTTNLPSGWNVQLAWSQDSSIYVRTDTPVMVDFMLTVPGTAIPDTRAPFSLTATSQNNSIRSDSVDIDVAASMISNASIGMTEEQMSRDLMIDAGNSLSLEFTIWNNASRQDIFSIEMNYNPDTNWFISQSTIQNAVINANSSTSFSIEVIAPSTGQSGDLAPGITPKIQSLRSSMIFQGEVLTGIEVRTISDLELRMVSLPSRLNPGLITTAVFEIENNGNGVVYADLSCEPIPDSWQWWLEIDEKNHTGPIELSAPYDAEDVVLVKFNMLLPSEEKAGEVHSFGCSVENSEGLVDLDLTDNTVEFDTITSAVRIPQIVGVINQTTATVGGMISVNATASNIGNALDTDFLVKASISVSPASEEIISFFTLGEAGASRTMDKYHVLSMAPGQEILLNVDILLPESITLNTRIVVRFEVIAGMNENMFPYDLNHEVLIVVDKQRKLLVEAYADESSVHATGFPVPLLVNLSSASTQSENYTLSAQYPDGWNIICQGKILNQTGQVIVHGIGNINQVNTDLMCEIHRISGPLEGDLYVEIHSYDLYHQWSQSMNIQFREAENVSSQISAQTVAVSFAGLLFILLCTLFFIRRRKTFEDESLIYIEQPSLTQPVEMSGPPVSISNQSANADSKDESTRGPTVPEDGLPYGWTMEQWQYYGQQYLDAKK